MSKVRVNCFSISLDGYGAGPRQSQKDPLGVGGEELHRWFYPTPTFKAMFGGQKWTEARLAGRPDGTTPDEDFARRGGENLGAWILGRNMFGPIRGNWPDDQWKGWWGPNPPYHVPVFVLTHHPRESFEMEGGTSFHFVTGGIHEALERAKQAAGDRDIRIGGGVQTVRQYLRAGLIDEMHLAVTPVLLGSGEHLLTGLDLPALGLRITEETATPATHHVVLRR
jgi:dihydrofolate reductase